MAMWSDWGSISMKANADLSAKQYFCVEMTAADTVDVVNAAADRCIGTLSNKPKINEAAQVQIAGVCKAVSDGSGTAIVVNDWVGADANGRVVKKETTDYAVLGLAMDASSAQGTVIRVLLTGAGVFRTALG